jgi:hypothetical protein
VRELRRGRAPVEVGLSGLLESGGRAAHRVSAPGSLVTQGFRWSGSDRWTQRWWPQGIAVGFHQDVPLAIVSWFSKSRRDRDRGTRITVLDLNSLRYRHVLLVEGDPFRPVSVHAGGIVWSGDQLLVAATFGGIREFRLSGILRRSRGRFVLPQVSHRHPAEKFRYSFLAEGPDGIVAGEYAKDAGGRLARMTLSEGAVSARDIHVPGIPEMQGAVLVDGKWAISSSRGDRQNGDLWVGEQGALARHAGALPPGPEDLAWWAERGQLWGVTEHPGQRWVFAADWPL